MLPTTTMDSPGTNSTTAFPPFNDPNADSIIRSSDGIHFYIHKSLLSLCSSVFEQMFVIPPFTEQESYDHRSCFSVSDDSHRLGLLLLWCDPRCMRSITSLDDIRDTLEMADKYSMGFVSNLVEKTVLSSSTRELMESDPFRLFAISARFRLENLSLEAAKETLRMPLTGRELARPDFIHQDFKYMSVFTLQQLLDYHVRCIKHAKQCIDGDLRWTETRWNGSQFVFVDRLHTFKAYVSADEDSAYSLQHSTSHDNEPETLRSQFAGGTKSVGWWNGFMDKVCALLDQTPYGLVAQMPSLLDDMRSVIALGSCEDCKKRGYEDLVEFSALLSGKIDEVVSQVPFHIEY